MFKSKGTFLKVLLLHNLVFMDLLFFGCVLLLCRQGASPNTLIKYAVVFYGAEGILSAGIKISKIVKDKKGDKDNGKDQLETEANK
jgi:hypothetical protein